MSEMNESLDLQRDPEAGKSTLRFAPETKEADDTAFRSEPELRPLKRSISMSQRVQSAVRPPKNFDTLVLMLPLVLSIGIIRYRYVQVENDIADASSSYSSYSSYSSSSYTSSYSSSYSSYASSYSSSYSSSYGADDGCGGGHRRLAVGGCG
jgi:hypothetical protein